MEDNVLQVNIDDIIPNRFQPRLSFDEQGLKELSASIKEHGIIQPLVLRKLGSKYEIIAGERRYKASIMAGLTTVPAVISNIDDNSSAEIALVENIQRRNLTPIEEARSYKNLLDNGYTQEQLAQKMGISQSSVANKLRLLNLDEEVQQALLEGKISERHARSLLVLNDSTKEKEWLARIINERLTVRQLDQELKKLKEDKNTSEIPLVDLSVNIDNIKNNSTEINQKKSPDIIKDDVLKDYSEETLDSKEESTIKIIDPDPVNESKEVSQNPFEVPNKTTFFETLEPLSEPEKANQANANKGYFSFNFEEPLEENTPSHKDLEVLPTASSNTNNDNNENQNPFSHFLDINNQSMINNLNPNNKFFTPINNEQVDVSPVSKPEELFDPMSLIMGGNPQNSSIKDLNVAKDKLNTVITELQSLGFKVQYQENPSIDNYQITITVE